MGASDLENEVLSGGLSTGTRAPVEIEQGSFRDRDGQVFYRNGEIIRGLSEYALAEWQGLSTSPLFQRLLEEQRIVDTGQVDAGDAADLAAVSPWAGYLRHERVPFVSYPYEWSFGMLKDAALLHLELLRASLDESMILKDSSAYNIQWRGASPVFIDIPSFQRMAPGEPWVAYRQFCEMFLLPLFLQAYREAPFHPWLRGNVDGIPVGEFAKLISFRDLFRAGVFKHVYLQSKLQSGYADTTRNVKSDLRSAGFGAELIKSNVRALIDLVKGLHWKQSRSEWSDYADDNSYAASDHQEKSEFVRNVVNQRRRKRVWDLGSNTGVFSRIAAENSDYVIAMDADHLAIERLYQSLKTDGPDNILPLVNNIADPSPALGWRLRERKTLQERGAPDLTLCLALIHHMVIGANIPMREFIDWLASLGSDLVIEFVTRDDPMVKKLLLNKSDNYTDYDLAFFESCLSDRFRITGRRELASGTRTLYEARVVAF